MATCTVSGKIQDLTGTGLSGVLVTAHLVNPYFNTTIMVVQYDGLNPDGTHTTQATTAGDGTWSLTLQQGASLQLFFDYPSGPNTQVLRRTYSIVVPSSGTANFSDLATEL